MKCGKIENKVWILVGPILFILVWLILSELKLLNPTLIPSLTTILKSLIEDFSNLSFWKNIFNTVWIWIMGTLLGICLGITLGILIGYFKRLYLSCEFLIDFFKSLPSILLYPIFLILFGIGTLTKIAIVIWASFFYVTINTLYGVKNARKSYDEISKTYHINRSKKFTKIMFPAALTDIFVGIRLAVSIGLILTLGSELILGTKYGIGRIVLDSLLVYDMPRLYSTLLITGFLGYMASKISVIMEDRTLHWRGR